MSLKAVCTGCQKAFNVPDEFAGKKVRCKQCGTAFRVPGGATVAAPVGAKAAAPAGVKASAPAGVPRPGAVTEAATGRRAPAPAAVPMAVADDDAGEYGLSDDDFGMLAQPVAAARPYTPTAASTPAYAAPAAAARSGAGATLYPSTGTTVAARNGGVAVADGVNWALWVQVGAFGLPLLLLLIGKLVPALATVGILAASFVAMAFMLWGQIGILIAALQESSLCGLLYLFMPLYPIYFILTRFEDVAPHVIRTIAGFALMAGAIMMILSQSPQ